MEMVLNILKKVFGTKNERDLKLIRPYIALINSFEPKMKAMSDAELAHQTVLFRERLARGESLPSLLPEAFATVREASVRTTGMRHFDVQLMGGMVLYDGKISEMKTGEGKTLVATLPLYLMALEGKGAHLVTVNEYLARRDSEWMGAIYKFLGLTVGCITPQIDDAQRKAAYACDITYGTNSEMGFDYLRDNMKFRLEDYAQRGHHFCIVDEVDSILIDEARTPLIISGPSEGNVSLYSQVNRLMPMLKADVDFKVDEKNKTAMLTEDGAVSIQKILRVDNLFDIRYTELLHHLNQALRANFLFKRDVDYVVKENKIVIVDEFTGRLKEGSRWSDGLHQAIEAKEGVTVANENQTLASITYQNYFRLYSKLAGMTGTADTEAEEFRKIYHLEVVVVPTHMKMIREDRSDTIYKTKEAKYNAIVEMIKELHEKKRPVLVGTIDIDTSELISNRLKKSGIHHEVLNAKQNEREAQIIALAGTEGAVTIATNMAGRGTDIKLTEVARAAGGLVIVGTERHEARRIDNQLRGRSGRQGDMGMSKFFLSLEDGLMRIFGGERIKTVMNRLKMGDDEPIEHRWINRSIEKAQKKVESHNFDIRKHLLEYDNVTNDQRKIIYRLRREILEDKGNVELSLEMIQDVCTSFVENHRPQKNVDLVEWPWEKINENFKAFFRTDKELSAAECSNISPDDVANYIFETAKMILEEKLSLYESETVRLARREILLSIIDQSWKDHLLALDHLKEGIGLRAYAQRDPLNEYKKDSFELFSSMKERVKQTVAQTLFSVKLYTPEEIETIERNKAEELKRKLESHQRSQQVKDSGHPTPIHRTSDKVGRNDPCPCGSGKKFKHCHGA